MSPAMRIESRLRLSGVLLMAGLAVVAISLAWEKPLAFLLFAGVGGALLGAGILIYLYSLVSVASPATAASLLEERRPQHTKIR
jgi:hypothetical protein